MSLLLGIDLGASKLALALAEARPGRAPALLARARRETRPSADPRRDVAGIASEAAALLSRAGAAPADLAGVGVCAPGPLDADRGVLLGPPNLPGWDEVPIGPWLSESLGRPVHLENDGNAAALAEWRFGAARGARDAVYLTMSTGVGGGLVLGGRLHRGRRGNAGELGHVPVAWDDGREAARCACGQRGCLEAYVGGAAWMRRLRERAPDAGRVAALAGGRERIAPEHAIEAARAGDPFALGELERFNHYLARGLAVVAFALAPEVVVLGTIPTAAGEALCLGPLRARLAECVWPAIARELRIAASALGGELPFYAGVGVALEALERGGR